MMSVCRTNSNKSKCYRAKTARANSSLKLPKGKAISPAKNAFLDWQTKQDLEQQTKDTLLKHSSILHDLGLIILFQQLQGSPDLNQGQEFTAP